MSTGKRGREEEKETEKEKEEEEEEEDLFKANAGERGGKYIDNQQERE